MIKEMLRSAAVMMTLASGIALAGGPELPAIPECEHCFKPFIGINYSYLSIDTQSLNQYNRLVVNAIGYDAVLTGKLVNTYNGIGFLFGMRYGSYFGVAMNMAHYFQENTNINARVNNVNYTLGVKNEADIYSAEARFYLPIYSFDLIGAVGAAFLQVQTSGSTVTAVGNYVAPNTLTTNRLAWNFGGGFDYYFTQNWGIEAMAHYMALSGSGFLSNFWTVNAGIDYMFS